MKSVQQIDLTGRPAAIGVSLSDMEYSALKAEQLERIKFRDNLVYVLLVSTGALMAVAFSTESNAGFRPVLLLPYVAFVLGWYYRLADQKVSDIGQYIRSRTRHDEERRSAVGWEFRHGNEPHYRSTKRSQLGVDVVLFSLYPLVAVVVAMNLSPTAPGYLALGIIGALLSVVTACLLFTTAADRRVEIASAPES